jgi:hypothetical protein
MDKVKKKIQSSKQKFSETDLVLKAQKDPVWWLQDCCGWHLWEKQKEIVRALQTHNRVAVPAAFGVGKTWIASRFATYWFNTRGPSIVVTTAPTARQVKDLLWAEIKDAYHTSKLPLGGEVLSTDIRSGHPKWFATGFATNEEHIDKFTGYHSPNMLLIFDQACGIHKQIWTAAEGLLTSANCKWLCLSNTTDEKSAFADICLPDRRSDFGHICEDPDCPGCSGWKIIKITAHDSPNVLAQRNVFPGILSYDYVESKKKVWRPGDPLWEVYIEANFVESGAMTVLHPTMIKEMLGTAPTSPNIEPDFNNIILGVDVGEEGSDPSVCAVALGKRLGFIERVLGNNPMQVVDFVIRMWEKTIRLTGHTPVAIYIDAIGVGSGPAARLSELGYPVIGVRVSNVATRNEEFLNRRIEMSWQIREMAEQRALSWKPYYHTEEILMEMLHEDMGIRYRPTPSQKIALEDKRIFRSRMRRSPDCWDAMVLAFSDTQYAPGITVIEGAYGRNPKPQDFVEEWNNSITPASSAAHLQLLAKLAGQGFIQEDDFSDEVILW